MLIRTTAAFVRARTVVLFALLFSAPTLQATGTIRWTGEEGHKITTPGNWNGLLNLLAPLQIEFGSSARQTIELHSHLLEGGLLPISHITFLDTGDGSRPAYTFSGHISEIGHSTPILSLLGDVTVQPGGNITFGGSLSISLHRGTTHTISIADVNTTVTVDSIIVETGHGGHASITKTGVGTLLLNAINTFSGSIIIRNGTIKIGADAALGTAPDVPTPGHLTFDGGTLWTTDTFDLNSNRGILVDEDGGTLRSDAETTLTYAGAITGSGDLVKAGSGKLVLSGDNSDFAGDLIGDAGTVSLKSSNALGSGDVIFGGDAKLDADIANAINGDIASLLLKGNAQLNANVAGAVSGGYITVKGESVINVGVNDALTSGVSIYFSNFENGTGGTLRLNGHNTAVGKIDSDTGGTTATGLIENGGSSNATLTIGAFDGEGDSSFSGIIQDGGSGSLAVIKRGTGNLTLGDGDRNGSASNGAIGSVNTFTGGLTVKQGTLTLGRSSYHEEGNPGVFESSPVGSGTLRLLGGSTLATQEEDDGRNDGIILHNSVALQTGGSDEITVNTTDANLTITGAISGYSDASLVKAGAGTLTLTSAESTFHGGIVVAAGTLAVEMAAEEGAPGDSAESFSESAGGPLGVGALTLGRNTTLALAREDHEVTLLNEIYLKEISGAAEEGSATLHVAHDSRLILKDAIYDAALVSTATSFSEDDEDSFVKLIKTGEGTLALGSRYSEFEGGLTVSEGRLELLASSDSEGSSIIGGPVGKHTLTMQDGTSLAPGTHAGGDITPVSPMPLAITLDNSIKLAAGAKVSLGGSAGSLRLTGAFDGGETITIKGDVTLAGPTATYTGETRVEAGTLTVDAADALPTGTGLGLSENTGFSVNFDQTIARFLGSISDEAWIAIDGGARLTIDMPANTPANFFGGEISGDGGLVIKGVTIGDEVDPTLLTLTGSNTYTGGTTIKGGVLSFTANALGSSGDITMDGGVLRWNNHTQDLSARIVMSNAKTAIFDTNGKDVSFGSGIGNNSSGSLRKVGTGSLTLSATNTYTGDTIVSGGTLLVTPGTVLNSAVLVGGHSASARFAGTGSIAGAVELHAHGGISPGGLNSAGTLSVGNTTFHGGSFLEFKISDVTGTAGTDWSLLNVNGTLTFNGTINSGAPITVYIEGIGNLAETANLTIPYKWQFVTATSIAGSINPDLFVFDGTVEFGTFDISIEGTSLYLNFTPVPEPSTWALLIAGLAVIAITATRRKK